MLSTAAPTCIKQMLTDLKGAVGSNTIILRDFVIPLRQWIDHSEESREEALALTHWARCNEHVHRASFSKVAEDTFFSRARGIFPRIDHMLGCIASLNKGD